MKEEIICEEGMRGGENSPFLINCYIFWSFVPIKTPFLLSGITGVVGYLYLAGTGAWCD